MCVSVSLTATLSSTPVLPPQLEELSITAEEHVGAWAVGIEALPKEWAGLRVLRRLELRGHSMLHVLPPWLADLPALVHLDIGVCRNNDISILPQMTRLRTLSLQVRRGSGGGLGGLQCFCACLGTLEERGR